MKISLISFVSFIIFSPAIVGAVSAKDLSVGDSAPTFELKDQGNQAFSLSSRKGKWTILYFYPKAETPGCTKQACAYRDSTQKLKELNAEVFGVSSDTVESLQSFQKNHKLSFTLLADPDRKVIKTYGVASILPIAKRVTFIIDPELKIRAIDRDVSPAEDARNVIQKLREFQSSK